MVISHCHYLFYCYYYELLVFKTFGCVQFIGYYYTLSLFKWSHADWTSRWRYPRDFCAPSLLPTVWFVIDICQVDELMSWVAFKNGSLGADIMANPVKAPPTTLASYIDASWRACCSISDLVHELLALCIHVADQAKAPGSQLCHHKLKPACYIAPM